MEGPAASQTRSFMYFFLEKEGENVFFYKLPTVGCKELI